jgi:predicted GNAT family N-acyltransferase
LASKSNEAEFRIEPLGRLHDRAAFSSLVPALDRYLHTQARQDAEKNLAVVFILTSDGKTVAGYYTLSQYSVRMDTIPAEIAGKPTKYPEIPATSIGRLAVAAAFRGQGLGEFLLMDALRRCLSISGKAASWAVIVDAKDENGESFYKKYGFLPLPKVPRRWFLAMATIEKLFPEG